jgi:hypothetical protein
MRREFHNASNNLDLRKRKLRADWRKLYNEEHNNLYSPSDIIKVTKPNRKRWVRHVILMEEIRTAYSILAKKI